MMKYRVWCSAVLVTVSGLCLAQSWTRAYEAGLKAGRSLKWTEARQDFKQAAAYRPDDVSAATILPGPPTSDRKWRNGSAYSPNFLAAYALYRSGVAETRPDAHVSIFNSAAQELEALLAKNQVSRESYYVLSTIYSDLADQPRFKALQDKYGAAISKSTWRVDTELVTPEESSAIASLGGDSTGSAKPGEPTVQARDINPGTGTVNTTFTPVVGSTAKIGSKFALVIGVQNPKLSGNLEFSNNDAVRVRDALVNYGGYPEANVDLLTNATSTEIISHAKALAARMPESGTICIFYSGIGSNLEGTDYIAGSDALSNRTSAGFVKKESLYSQFFSTGSHIFAFFQVDRSAKNPTSAAFGSDQGFLGAVSQMQATVPGDTVLPTYRNGKVTGVFTDAFAQTMLQLQSNRLPIMEFGWQVFYHMRRGDTGQLGGSSHQTPTLPQLNNMATDSPF